ncbi:MAG TPA: Clp protease N-terminal domain-containing protein, partial [Thermoanaerobaculia bacterium]
MNFEQLTLKNQEVLQEAVRLARTAGNAEVSPEHIAVALLDQEGGTAAALLDRVGVMVAACLGELRDLLGRLPRTEG